MLAIKRTKNKKFINECANVIIKPDYMASRKGQAEIILLGILGLILILFFAGFVFLWNYEVNGVVDTNESNVSMFNNQTVPQNSVFLNNETFDSLLLPPNNNENE